MHPKMSFGARSTMCVRASNAALAINSSLPPLSVPVVARQSLTNGFLHGVLRSSLQLPRYPKMVEGVVACDVYSKKKEGPVDVTCATYKLKSAGFSMQCVCQQRLSPHLPNSALSSDTTFCCLLCRLAHIPSSGPSTDGPQSNGALSLCAARARRYYMKHYFEPKKHSMTFHLDYDRCSDIQDSVGYWFVEDLKDGWCRVYYSTDSKLPKFIPNFAKDAIVNLAAKRSTSWVLTRCNEITGNTPSAEEAGAPRKGKLRPPRLGAALLVLAAAWRSGKLPAGLPDLGSLPATLAQLMSEALAVLPRLRLQPPIRLAALA